MSFRNTFIRVLLIDAENKEVKQHFLVPFLCHFRQMNLLLGTNTQNIDEFDVVGQLLNGDYMICNKRVEQEGFENLMTKNSQTFKGNGLIIGGFDDEMGVLPCFLDPEDIQIKFIDEDEIQLWERCLN